MGPKGRSRRSFLQLVGGVGAIVAGGGSIDAWARADSPEPARRPPTDRLLDGNERFATGRLSHPNQTVRRRKALETAQHPYAAILTCGDSATVSEIVFDQGLGDLFVIRTAGNVVDEIVLGSLEYAVEHLHVGLIVVMGHGGCGAVAAAVEGHHVPGHLSAIVKRIAPAVEEARHQPGNLLSNAISANARLQAGNLLSKSPILRKASKAEMLRVVPWRYELSTGRVDCL